MSETLTPDQWQQVRALFEAALEREPPDAAAWAQREARHDAQVRDEVLSLLQHHSRAGEFLSQPVAERLPDLLEDDRVLEAGATIGPYTIIRELGRGGMGRVYLATDSRLNRTVALKVLAPHLLRDPLQRERLRREARAAAGLAHPGICTVFALEEFDGELYIAAEYIDGQTLGEEIRTNRRPSEDEILRTAREVAAALAAAHELGTPTAEKLFAKHTEDVLVFGHTHKAVVVRDRSGRLAVNPGAAGPRRFALKPSVALLRIERGRAEVEIIWLE